MAPDSGHADQQLDIHPQRNVPSSLMKKRCAETFATILQDYEQSVERPIKWALISESGRPNKILLVSVFGEHDPFPFTRRPKDKGEGENEHKEEDKGKTETKIKTQDESDIQSESKAQGEKPARSDNDKPKIKGAERFKGDDGKKQKKDQRATLRGAADDEEIPIPIPTMTETYQIINSSEEEDGGDPKKKTRKTYTERYPVVATIMNGALEWMCDDPGYAGYEDKTSYFNKDGLSLVDSISFHDHITQRELAALAELEKVRLAEDQEMLAQKDAKKAAKKARQKPLRAVKKLEKKAEMARKEALEADKAKTAREKARKAKLAAEQSGAEGEYVGTGHTDGGDGGEGDGEGDNAEPFIVQVGSAELGDAKGDSVEGGSDKDNNAKGNSADRRREKAKAKKLRQKQRRIQADKDMAAEQKAKERAQEENLKAFYKQHTGEDLKTEDATSRVQVVDPNSSEGAFAIAQAKKRGLKMFPATKINDD